MAYRKKHSVRYLRNRAKKQYAMHERKYHWHWRHKNRKGFLRHMYYHEDCMNAIASAKRPLNRNGHRYFWNKHKNS